MTQPQISREVATSSWQPTFEFTTDLDTVVDSILKPHEDYFLKLHSKVEEIIEREIAYAKTVDLYQITFADVCNWQKELFEHKKELIEETFTEKVALAGRASRLPNQHITLGLRTTNVEVGDWTPPHPMFLKDLKEMCFPIKVENNEFLTLPVVYDNGLIAGSKVDDEYFKYWITEWYKTFETIHFYEDLNGRVGGITINILSYLMTGKYLIKSN